MNHAPEEIENNSGGASGQDGRLRSKAGKKVATDLEPGGSESNHETESPTPERTCIGKRRQKKDGGAGRRRAAADSRGGRAAAGKRRGWDRRGLISCLGKYHKYPQSFNIFYFKCLKF